MDLGGLLVAAPIAAALEDEVLNAVADPTGAAGPAGRSMAALRARLVRLLRRQATVDERRAIGIVDDLLAELVAGGRLERAGDRLHVPGSRAELPPALLAAMDRLERSLSTPAPPALSEAARAGGCPPDGVRALEVGGPDHPARRRTWRMRRAPTATLAETALRMAGSGPLTPAAYRDATGTSRKYVLAILEDLDRRGILRRTPAGHLPGPRAAALDEIGRPGR